MYLTDYSGFTVIQPTGILTALALSLLPQINDSDLVLGKSYGKAIPKKCQLSPDGWFQVSKEHDTAVFTTFATAN